MTSNATFGPALRGLRRTLGLSQLALAARIGSTQRLLSFLETGRSRPSPQFLAKLCAELNLSTAERSALFVAAGLHNPYAPSAAEPNQQQMLDVMAQRILSIWPFPAFILDRHWSVLRSNVPAQRMFAMLGIAPEIRPNMLALLLSEAFTSRIRNWETASQGLYFRLLAASDSNPDLRAAFDAARPKGMFDHIPETICGIDHVPAYIPVEIAFPELGIVRLTPFIGQLATVQDIHAESYETEFMVPLDDASEAKLRAVLNAASKDVLAARAS